MSKLASWFKLQTWWGAPQELARVESEYIRKQAGERLAGEVFLTRHYLVGFLLLALFAALASTLITWAFEHYTTITVPHRVDRCFWWLLMFAIWAGQARLYRRYARRKLRAILADLGVPVCVRCGYDLRGQSEARCPECGGEFDTRLLGDLPRPSRRSAQRLTERE